MPLGRCKHVIWPILRTTSLFSIKNWKNNSLIHYIALLVPFSVPEYELVKIHSETGVRRRRRRSTSSYPYPSSGEYIFSKLCLAYTKAACSADKTYDHTKSLVRQLTFIPDPDRSPRQRRRDSPRQPPHVQKRLAAAEPRADTTPPAAAAPSTATAAAGGARAPTGRRRRRRRSGARAAATAARAGRAGAGVAADGEAGLGAVVVRRRLPGERHVQQDGTGKC